MSTVERRSTPRETPPAIWPFPTYKGQPLKWRRQKKQPLPQEAAKW